MPGNRLVLPWGLAVAARESIKSGNEYRQSGVTTRDIEQICSKYNNLYDPLYDDHDVLAYLVRVAYEQFPFQESLFNGMARSRLLFECPSSRAAAKLKLIGESFWRDTLGFSLEALFTAGMFFGVGALQNNGRFDLGWYGQSNFARVRELISEADAVAMMGHFSGSREEIRDMCPKLATRGLERVAFNPLIARPFIRLSGLVLLAPVPTFVFWRASAPSLYYIALDHLGDGEKATFTDDVGTLFEDYVVRQAEQLRDAQPEPVGVFPEIEYRLGAFTTDAILVFRTFVLIVEAKATRLTEQSRMGGPTLLKEVRRTIGRGLEQIAATASLVTERSPALERVPADLPIYGLIVTLEPYHVVDFVRDELTTDTTSVPTAVCSIADFERFIADCLAYPRHEADVASRVNASRTSWDIAEFVTSSPDERFANPMLDREYDSLTAPLFSGPGGISEPIS